jgi:hypothetical protein
MSSLLPDTAKYDHALQLRACQSSSRRNGKVARLPAAIRDQINHLMDDGVPYKVIIEKLGPAARHLNEDNLSNWRLGGYQDYLKAQAINDRARIQTEAAADFVRDTAHLDPTKLKQACTEMALLQYLDTIMEHGEQCARDSLTRNPAKFITLMNACANVSNANIALEKRRWRNADFAPVRKDSAGSQTCSLLPAEQPEPRPPHQQLDRLKRSADLQSAVSQTCSLQAVREPELLAVSKDPALLTQPGPQPTTPLSAEALAKADHAPAGSNAPRSDASRSNAPDAPGAPNASTISPTPEPIRT